MKKTILAAIYVLGITATAEAQSMIKVHLASNAPLNVAVDGRYFNKRGTSVTVGDLPPGRHFVQVYSMMRTMGGRLREDIIYEGKVRTNMGMVTVLEYDPEHRSSSIQMQDVRDYMASRPPAGSDQGDMQDNDENDRQPRYDNNYSNNNYNNGGSDVPAASPVAAPVATGTLTEAKLDKLKTEVTPKKTDTEKTNALKAGLKDEKITTAQVSAMLDWFYFESSKLEFAEWAWSQTVDQENYENLSANFKYKNYQDELEKFLKTK